jgi:hypothetical protein
MASSKTRFSASAFPIVAVSSEATSKVRAECENRVPVDIDSPRV